MTAVKAAVKAVLLAAATAYCADEGYTWHADESAKSAREWAVWASEKAAGPDDEK